MKNIIFWLTNYPRSITGTLEVLSQVDNYNVTCICLKKTLDSQRIKMGWTYDDLPHVNFIFLDQISNIDKYLNDYLNENYNSIHFYGGFRVRDIHTLIVKHIFPRGEKVIIFSERPYLYKANYLKRIISFLMYFYYQIRFGRYISAYLVMGLQGVEAFRIVGWENKKLFPFLYHKKFTPTSTFVNNISQPVKILYVGQFDERKGIDTLMNAFSNLNSYNYELYLVGKNGNLYEKTINWVNKNEKAKYLGVWDTKQLEDNIFKFDLCLVPSKFDGWGMFTMESILSGVGVITTDQTSSKDLVKMSKAGFVIKENNISELVFALKSVLNDERILMSWKLNALSYRPYINDESLKSYVVNIIDYVEGKKIDKPHAPWIF